MTTKGEILVVDDDPDIRNSLRIVLEGNGYVVKTAANGRDALKAMEERKPDLMILDVMMTTDTEGFDLAYVIKNNPKFDKLPIIMLTCFLEKIRKDGPEQFQNVMGEEWPAKWLFEKPVELKKLLTKIEGILTETRY